jgi:TusA-related sulfurtransferase
MADIPAWCRTTGQTLVSMERRDKIITFVVQRVK